MNELTWKQYKEVRKTGVRYTPFKVTNSENHIFMLDDKCQVVKVQLPKESKQRCKMNKDIIQQLKESILLIEQQLKNEKEITIRYNKRDNKVKIQAKTVKTIL